MALLHGWISQALGGAAAAARGAAVEAGRPGAQQQQQQQQQQQPVRAAAGGGGALALAGSGSAGGDQARGLGFDSLAGLAMAGSPPPVTGSGNQRLQRQQQEQLNNAVYTMR